MQNNYIFSEDDWSDENHPIADVTVNPVSELCQSDSPRLHNERPSQAVSPILHNERPSVYRKLYNGLI